MNDISIPWKKITRGLPKGRKYAYDTAPTMIQVYFTPPTIFLTSKVIALPNNILFEYILSHMFLQTNLGTSM
jgi:hypothetical protein